MCHTLSVSAICPYQTAPTALYNKSGYPLVELGKNEEALLIYNLNDTTLSFGE